MNIVFFGAPGVGKGTQAALLAESLGIPHISTGAIFRSAMESGRPLGEKVKSYYDQGMLVPDELTTAIALEALAEPACEKGFILDGYPRNTAQAKSLDEAMNGRERPINHVIYLTAPEEELIQRMLGRGRADDSREVIENRLKVYEAETAPVLEYYRATDHVLEVNGVGDIDEVHRRILSAIGRRGA